jgi:DNA-directed RNA polymerase subunit RPC12/RpoP
MASELILDDFVFAPVCHKCGWEVVEWVYVEAVTFGRELAPEYLWLTCQRCGHVWGMKPKSDKKNADV